MKFNHVNLPVSNLGLSINFYTRLLGMKFKKYFSLPNGKAYKAVLKSGDFDFFLEESSQFDVNKSFHLGFKTPYGDLKKIFKDKRLRKHLFKGSLKENPPMSATHRFYIKDPDGHIIEFYDDV